MKLIPVKGHNGLARDPKTGAIININTTEIENAKKRKAARRIRDQEFQRLSDENRVLHKRIDDLEDMIRKVLEKYE